MSSYLKGIDSQLNKRPGGNILTTGSSGGHTKMIGTSRNPTLVAPAGTKNKIAGQMLA